MANNLVKKVIKQAAPAGYATVGNLGGRVLKNKLLPATINPLLRMALPVVIGLAAMTQEKSDVMHYAGVGMVSGSLADTAIEKIPGLQGIDDMDLSGIFEQLDLADDVDGVGEYDDDTVNENLGGEENLG